MHAFVCISLDDDVISFVRDGFFNKTFDYSLKGCLWATMRSHIGVAACRAMDCQLRFFIRYASQSMFNIYEQKTAKPCMFSNCVTSSWKLKLWTRWSARVYWLLKEVKVWLFKVNSGLLPLTGYRQLSGSIKSLGYATQERVRVSWDVQSTSRKEYAYSLFTGYEIVGRLAAYVVVGVDIQ